MIADDVQQGITYFKRFRMEADLLASVPTVPELPLGFAWLPWREDLLEQHARAKQQSFHNEVDGVIFPNLSNYEGCLRLMRDIWRRPGFCAAATWLIIHDGVPCGTIQGISDRLGAGVVQNLGVIPAYRGRGIGTALMLKAMVGFRQAGLGRAALEVTAQNGAAVRLYRRLGFRCRRTLYKAVDALAAAAATPEIDWWL
ncbi:MAG: GNAT family N-acetyltransferase [Gemmataceae bacterium]|nr:GNAT family N-acetyltransferase [Gemmataceae bacterium]